MKYFIYARKSTESEDRQMASIDDQIAEMKRLAMDFKLQIVDIISEAKSAKEPGRKEFNTMLKRIEKGEAEGILCWKLNRLARNPVDGGQISWLLQNNVIRHIQTYGRDYRSSDNVLMMQVEFGMANQYIKDLSVDVKRGLRQKAQRGWYAAKLPVGYLHVHRSERKALKHNSAEIIRHPDYFEIVKTLWHHLLTGKYSVLEIKRIGDKTGMCHKDGRPYSNNAYYKMFSNEFYSGYYYWKNEREELVRYKGNHEAMITPSEFHYAQNIIHKKEDVRIRQYFFPYRGLITCGDCNGHVTAENKLQVICTGCKFKFSIKRKTLCPKCKLDVSKMNNPSKVDITYYHCTRNKGMCTGGSISEENLEKEIINSLQKISIHKDFHDWGMQALRALNKTNEAGKSKAITPLKKRETELMQRVNGLIRMRADGEITSDEFDKLKKDTMCQVSGIQAEIIQKMNETESLEKEITNNFDFTLNGVAKFKNGNDLEKKEVVSKLASNLTLREKNLYITTEKVLHCIKECEVKYISEMSGFEPKKALENYSSNTIFDLPFQLLCAELTAIRTCLLDIISKNKINKPQ